MRMAATRKAAARRRRGRGGARVDKWERGKGIVLKPVELERDEKGWPRAFWELAGSAPDFDLGDRGALHERGDVLAPRRRR